MREVMLKAQALAEAILASDVYQNMHALEEQVTRDEAATAAIAEYMEKRNAVQAVIGEPEKLAEAMQALQAADDRMSSTPLVADMRQAQQKFTDMMDSINQILRLVVTGEVDEGSSGCTGNCASCGGCK